MERDSLQKQVMQLQQRLKSCGADESCVQPVLGQTLKPRIRSCIKYGLQLAILVGYFCYEEYTNVCKEHQ